MRRKRRRRRRHEVPLADRARREHEELGDDAPVVSRLGTAEGFDDTAFAAGVMAAGESDRPAGSHAAPEYPIDEPAPEFEPDRVIVVEPDREK